MVRYLDRGSRFSVVTVLHLIYEVLASTMRRDSCLLVVLRMTCLKKKNHGKKIILASLKKSSKTLLFYFPHHRNPKSLLHRRLCVEDLEQAIKPSVIELL